MATEVAEGGMAAGGAGRHRHRLLLLNVAMTVATIGGMTVATTVAMTGAMIGATISATDTMTAIVSMTTETGTAGVIVTMTGGTIGPHPEDTTMRSLPRLEAIGATTKTTGAAAAVTATTDVGSGSSAKCFASQKAACTHGAKIFATSSSQWRALVAKSGSWWRAVCLESARLGWLRIAGSVEDAGR
jgi:hypothetical protein